MIPPVSTSAKVHPADWSLERISAFWDNYASVPHFRERFFSLTCGDGVLQFIEPFVAQEGVVLDYGCGQGDMMRALLARGRSCMGVDSSPENVRFVNERLSGQPGFLGAFAPTGQPSLPAVPATVLLIEVIEHMPRSAATEFLGGIALSLPAGGRLVITCPNQEDIVRAEVLCPECACRFHPVQHLQSLSPQDVATLAAGAGFETVFAGATRFGRNAENRLVRRALAAWCSLIRRAPHLAYVGQKR